MMSNRHRIFGSSTAGRRDLESLSSSGCLVADGFVSRSSTQIKNGSFYGACHQSRVSGTEWPISAPLDDSDAALPEHFRAVICNMEAAH